MLLFATKNPGGDYTVQLTRIPPSQKIGNIAPPYLLMSIVL
jgi:hypothetical protein